MRFILFGTGLCVGASLLITLLVRVGYLVLRKSPRRFWIRALWVHAVLVPLFALVVVPAAVGFLGARMVGTRGDEASYQGPRIDAAGNWQLQSRESLAEESRGKSEPDAEILRLSRERAVHFEASDGIALRGFLVSPREQPTASVVLVHGLFRGALELETVARWFRDLGAEVLLLELRNHGASGREAASFGMRESRDVEAAAAFLRSREATGPRPLILFGVSLGTAAVSLAAPRIKDLRGLVLDAPMTDLEETAERMLDGDRLAIPNPFRFLIFRCMEWWGDFRFQAIRPVDSLGELADDLPALIIGGEEDDRMPPAVVRAVYAGLASPDSLKELWICPKAAHGKVWEEDPEGYQRKLQTLLDRVLAGKD